MPSRQRKQHPHQVGRGPVEEGSGAGRGGRHGKGRGTPGVEELGGSPFWNPFPDICGIREDRPRVGLRLLLQIFAQTAGASSATQQQVQPAQNPGPDPRPLCVPPLWRSSGGTSAGGGETGQEIPQPFPSS